jgi:hypothetical protein
MTSVVLSEGVPPQRLLFPEMQKCLPFCCVSLIQWFGCCFLKLESKQVKINWIC